MAQVAIEKKSTGMPWWAWLLVAFLIVALIWYFAARDTGTERFRTTEPAAMGDTDGTITSIGTLFGVTNASEWAGREVASEPAQVLSVTGDRTFWVGNGVGQQVFVVLDEQPTPNQPATEGRYDVNPGQMVRVYGTVQQFPGFDEAQNRWNVGEDTRVQLQNQHVYVHADRLEITSRP